MTMIDEPDRTDREANQGSECAAPPATWLRRHRSVLLAGTMICGGLVLISLDHWAATFRLLGVLVLFGMGLLLFLHHWRT